MSLFHFHVTQVKRSAGQSVVASAAYRAGEKLYSEYYGETSDYTNKSGVIYSDIFLPSHAPPEYKERASLWNAVEKAERSKKAQLAYSFDIALQNEFSIEENIALAKRFISEQLVSRGMIADIAVHMPDAKDGGISNPHFHILCPIRPIEENGKWGCKQRRRYRLDEDGNRIMGENGKALFDAVPTTDWGNAETLEQWRAAWASMINEKFIEKGLESRIDHRSYERQGLKELPTVHEGVAVRQMEVKGIITEKGERNRFLKTVNITLRDIKRKIKSLTDWIHDIKAELSKPKEKNLAELLSAYYSIRNAGAWSMNAKANNLTDFAEAVNYLTENQIFTLNDLEYRVEAAAEQTEAVNSSMKAKSARMKELEKLLQYAEDYQRLKPIIDEMNAIKWKSKREKFRAENENKLKIFYKTRRNLKKYIPDIDKIPVSKWRQESENLKQEYKSEYEKYKPMREELLKMLRVKNCVDTVMHKQDKDREKRQELRR